MIQKGDKVKLKTGGPGMTVDEIDGEAAYCVWFDGSELKKASFALTSLEKY